MKPIKDMTTAEMEKEIRDYKFKDYEKYIFVSYSHRDADAVYPAVLNWIRMGYNIYIDLDFVKHGSDKNWVNLMKQRLRDHDCALMAVFYSKNSAFSYAALLELLTARSEKTSEIRGGVISIDIYTINDFANDKDISLDVFDSETKRAYDAAFEKLQANMGKSF